MRRKKKSPKIQVSAKQASVIGMLVGTTLALVGAGMLFWISSEYSRHIQAASQVDRSYVVVTNRDLMPGVKITEDDVYMVSIPTEFIPEGVFRDPEHVVGRLISERVLSNEFIRKKRLLNPESGEGMNAILPLGMRALSIEIADGRALSGHLKPASYVDVLVTMATQSDDEKEPKTVTVAQGLFVLAVNEAAEMPQSPQEARDHGDRQLPPSVTLLLEPEDAERITHAERLGTVTLTLRNELDKDYQTRTGVDVDSLLDGLRIGSRKE